jgi:hypothetical protein
MVAGVTGLQFFAEIFWPALLKVHTQSGDLIGQDSVVFGEGVPNNNPIKHAESAGKQESGGQRK